jgi:hypothetical protein
MLWSSFIAPFDFFVSIIRFAGQVTVLLTKSEVYILINQKKTYPISFVEIIEIRYSSAGICKRT